jgi:hypothetical protein
MEDQMNTIKGVPLLIAGIAITVAAACNYTVGECWPVGQGGGSSGESVTAGGGVIIPSGPAGVGGYGDTPPKQPQDATDPKHEIKCNSDETDDTDTETENPNTEPSCTAADIEVAFWTCGDNESCSAKCFKEAVAGGPFAAKLFNFVTIVADDGNGPAGGWQEAVASLKIARMNYLVIPEIWFCPVKIGMPLRTTVYGEIPPSLAAQITVQIANKAAKKVRSTEPDLPQGIFCQEIYSWMKTYFVSDWPSLGARVN